MKRGRHPRLLCHLLCLPAAMLLIVLSAQAQSDAVLPPIGGSAGRPFVARCPQGRYLAGLELRTGDDVDAIRPLCVLAYGPQEVGQLEIFPTSYGGDGGGNMIRLLCPGEAPVVTGMYIRAEGVTTVVNNIHLFCGMVAGNQTVPEKPSAEFDGAEYHPNILGAYEKGGTRLESTLLCPVGLVAVGVNGRSGIWLDALGLVCGAPALTPRPVAPGTVGSIGRVKAPVGSIGRVRVTHPASIYGVGGDGSLQWFSHDGTVDGEVRGPRSVNVGWNSFKLIFPGGAGIIYAVTRQGALLRYQHAGFGTGLGRDDPGGWLPTQEIAKGWGGIAQAFSAGDGIIYTVTPDGKLWWFRHTGFVDGRATWVGPKNVGRGWEGFRQVFSGGDGVVYAIASDGRLWWYKHAAYRTGGTLGEPGAWEGGTVVGHGWEGFTHVFSPGDGVIYAVSADGRLRWYRHKDYRTGKAQDTPRAWEGGTVISNDWAHFIDVFGQ